MNSRILAVVVAAILALQGVNSSQCEPVSPSNASPPVGATVVAAVKVEGERLWLCDKGNLADTGGVVHGIANITDYATNGGFSGGFNSLVSPNVMYIKTPTGEEWILGFPPPPAVTNYTDRVSDARWLIEWVSPVPEYLKDSSVYVVRTDVEGGMEPTKCANATAEYAEVPFNAIYTIYSCDDVAPAPGAAPSSAVLARGVAEAAALIAATAAAICL